VASGGTLDGTWHEGVVPGDAKLLAVSESPPLSSIVIDMNKFSNNVMARQLFLTIGAQKNPPGTVESADSAVRAWLDGQGLDFPELVMENGSGLSRTARISTMHLGELLGDAYRSPLMPTFFASLPIAGVDGTMKKRLATSPVAGRAWIKTGSLEDTRAIAGIIQTQSGKRFIVVCIVNDPGAGRAKPFEDALLMWIEQHG
jgi:D-alanyl-D-alanine carboxypeptidase/D-alanyl-D-alanine-endopeptidase (penicillin-binding protein 4)